MQSEKTFVAIDFETATPDKMACQLGIVSVVDGEVTGFFNGQRPHQLCIIPL